MHGATPRAAAFAQPTRRRSRPATLQRARTTLRPAGVTSMCQVMRSAGRAGTVTATGACFSIGSPYPNGCKWRRSRRFSGCVSPSPSGVDRSADGPGDGPVVRLDDSEFRRNGNVRTEMTAATGFGHACTVRAGPGAGADVRSTRSSRWPHLARFPPGDGDPGRTVAVEALVGDLSESGRPPMPAGALQHHVRVASDTFASARRDRSAEHVMDQGGVPSRRTQRSAQARARRSSSRSAGGRPKVHVDRRALIRPPSRCTARAVMSVGGSA
jgi:hypothetical protein